jgi:hypothetical protein
LHLNLDVEYVGQMPAKTESRPGVFDAVKAEADQNWVFGLQVDGPLSADSRMALYDLVVLRQGTLHDDGWITLPRRSAVTGLIDAAAEIGVRLSASVRRR